jgi:hypothetical protein
VVDAGLRAFFFSKTAVTERPAAKQLGRWREASGIVAEYVDFRRSVEPDRRDELWIPVAPRPTFANVATARRGFRQPCFSSKAAVGERLGLHFSRPPAVRIELVGPPVALALDVFARSLAKIGRADDDDLEALRPGLVASPRTGRDAHHVPLPELDDLVVELHPPAPAHDHVGLTHHRRGPGVLPRKWGCGSVEAREAAVPRRVGGGLPLADAGKTIAMPTSVTPEVEQQSQQERGRVATRTGRAPRWFTVVLVVVAAFLVAGAVFRPLGWTGLIVLGAVVGLVIGLMIAVNPRRRSPAGGTSRR